MPSHRRGRPAPLAIARVIATAVVAGVVLGGCSGSAPPPAPTVTADGARRVELAFADGAVTGGVTRFAVPLGSAVELVVASDVADEVHLHGYDRQRAVTAGATTTLRFTADLPGVFEVELERLGAPLCEIQVS